MYCLRCTRNTLLIIDTIVFLDSWDIPGSTLRFFSWLATAGETNEACHRSEGAPRHASAEDRGGKPQAPPVGVCLGMGRGGRGERAGRPGSVGGYGFERHGLSQGINRA